jgi:hypothetical protein
LKHRALNFTNHFASITLILSHFVMRVATNVTSNNELWRFLTMNSDSAQESDEKQWATKKLGVN